MIQRHQVFLSSHSRNVSMSRVLKLHCCVLQYVQPTLLRFEALGSHDCPDPIVCFLFSGDIRYRDAISTAERPKKRTLHHIHCADVYGFDVVLLSLAYLRRLTYAEDTARAPLHLIRRKKVLEGYQVDLELLRLQIYRDHNLGRSFLWLHRRADTGRPGPPPSARGGAASHASVLMSVAAIEMDKAAFARGDIQKVGWAVAAPPSAFNPPSRNRYRPGMVQQIKSGPPLEEIISISPGSC